ncbi:MULTISPECIES: hypothetical protein [unclassified Paenibacillus]|jgi:hypothetical protein|uniref:hypothetical protein n=1 Tax=unclassified Paenibacillus TaxID=185978 RepID=UPI0004B54D5E|nr:MULTISPECIES: hypothetical protein [unclassified Paenibacillus]
MNDILVQASSSAVTMVGKPEQIMAVMAGWMKQYGRDMPLSYILLLQADSRIKASKAG